MTRSRRLLPCRPAFDTSANSPPLWPGYYVDEVQTSGGGSPRSDPPQILPPVPLPMEVARGPRHGSLSVGAGVVPWLVFTSGGADSARQVRDRLEPREPLRSIGCCTRTNDSPLSRSSIGPERTSPRRRSLPGERSRHDGSGQNTTHDGVDEAPLRFETQSRTDVLGEVRSRTPTSRVDSNDDAFPPPSTTGRVGPGRFRPPRLETRINSWSGSGSSPMKSTATLDDLLLLASAEALVQYSVPTRPRDGGGGASRT
jgi:hypothetical protein